MVNFKTTCVQLAQNLVKNLLSRSMATFRNQKIPTCYASCSVGYKKEHTLPEKLKAISTAGFTAIELSMPDVLAYGEQLKGVEISPRNYGELQNVGKKIKELCDQHSLKILMLQPFANFEGWREDPQRKDAFERATGWMSLMEAVGTDMLQIGSSDAASMSASFDDMAKDLRELADIFAKKGFRIAYENWSWATYAPGWREIWEIVKKVDRPNLGLCLDTFQSAGGEWGDPRSKSGLMEDVERQELESKWKQSCRDLAATVPAEKIFLLQISDAYKMDPAILDKMDDSGLRPRAQWSQAHRPLPYHGGYLPVEDFTKAVFATGFRGWCSIEVFDSKASSTYEVMDSYTEKAMQSLVRLMGQIEE